MDPRSNLSKRIQGIIAIVLPPYIHHKRHIEKGNGEFTFLRHPIQLVILAKIAYDWLPLWLCAMLIISYLLLCKFFGWFWDENKGYDIEHEWGNQRNPFVKHVKRKL